MPLRSDPLDTLKIPDGTTVEEHDLVTDGDVIVGGQSTVEFGVRGHNVIAGERVRFGGDIEAEGDCRLDMWCDVEGNVLVGENAYLGERVHVGGQLMVSGDLDIGDDVDIEDGFEANGWIVIRNPMPTIVFLFVYLSHLLRIGEEEMAENVLSEMTDSDEHGHEPVLIPRNGSVSDDAWRVSTPATVGDDCRLHGNIRAESLSVGEHNEIFGSLRAREDIDIGSGTEVTGNVTTRTGTVRVAADAHVRGDVSGDDVHLHEDAVVEGSIRARGETTFVRDAELDGDDEVTDSELDADDEVTDDELDADEESVADETATDTATDDDGAADDAAPEAEHSNTDDPDETGDGDAVADDDTGSAADESVADEDAGEDTAEERVTATEERRKNGSGDEPAELVE